MFVVTLQTYGCLWNGELAEVIISIAISKCILTKGAAKTLRT